MLKAGEYLPIGSVVLLENGMKKAMIIGIMQSMIHKEDQSIKEYDYIAVVYPEGFVNVRTMIMFNHSQISEVVFRGYENEERDELVAKIDENMKIYT